MNMEWITYPAGYATVSEFGSDVKAALLDVVTPNTFSNLICNKQIKIT